MCDWFEKGFFLEGGKGGVATNSLKFLRVVEEQVRGEYLIMI